ncbi:putative rhamnogalacturonan acetylesterase YesY [compost metagenome]
MKSTKLMMFAFVVSAILFASFVLKDKPKLFLVGDSTVSGGWGKFMHQFIDTTQISIQNRAISGASSRSYYTAVMHDPNLSKNGGWKGVMKDIKPGDYVMIQFGHNDDSPVVDTLRARGTIPGIGTDSVVLDNHFSKKKEIVHSYGWYLSKMVSEVRKKGAFPIICSPIPKDRWKDGKVLRADELYGKWSKEVAIATKTSFINLNHLIADKLDAEGEAKVTGIYFAADRVHPTTAGSILGAKAVVEGIKNASELKLNQYLKP